MVVTKKTPEQANTVEEMLTVGEAMDWIGRIRKEGHTRQSGDHRLQGILDDIKRIRGEPAMRRLLAEIERQLGRSIGYA